MVKKLIRQIRSETDYDAALNEIERYFEKEPKPGTPEADRFDLLALEHPATICAVIQSANSKAPSGDFGTVVRAHVSGAWRA